MLVGIISDTHGLLRPEALAALAGVELILHAGDVGAPTVLRGLERIAPVRAVRGNNDKGGWASRLPLLHDLHELAVDPAAEGYAVVVSGHSHQPLIRRDGDVLYVNPGSAGPRRFRLPITLARMRVEDGRPEAEIIELSPATSPIAPDRR